jgi:hypothetical protein
MGRERCGWWGEFRRRCVGRGCRGRQCRRLGFSDGTLIDNEGDECDGNHHSNVSPDRLGAALARSRRSRQAVMSFGHLGRTMSPAIGLDLVLRLERLQRVIARFGYVGEAKARSARRDPRLTATRTKPPRERDVDVSGDRPSEVLTPLFDRFSRTPGRTRKDILNRRPMAPLQLRSLRCNEGNSMSRGLRG